MLQTINTVRVRVRVRVRIRVRVRGWEVYTQERGVRKCRDLKEKKNGERERERERETSVWSEE